MTDERWFYGMVLGAGVIAGLRSASAPAAVSTALARGGWPNGDDPVVALAARLAPWLRAAALAELGADKLPMMPNRTSPPALAGRLAFGALSGALLARACGRGVVGAALLAAAGALAGSFGGLRLRMLIGERLGIPSAAAGLLEDAVVVAAAGALVGGAAPHLEPAPMRG